MATDHRLTLAKVQALKPETSITPADGVGILVGSGLLAWGLTWAGLNLPQAAPWPALKMLLFMAAVFLGIIGAGNFYEGVLRRAPLPLLDGEIVARARELEAVPEEISQLLDRALSAYGGIQRLAAERIWERSGTRIGDYLRQARGGLMGLLEQSRHLVQVAATLGRFQGQLTIPEPYGAVSEEYDRHLERLEAATRLMEEAEASLSRALLAISADATGVAVGDDPLREMNSNFAALAEVLEASSGTALSSAADLPEILHVPSEEPAAQQVGARL